jgi:hypothetical protein
VPVETFNNDQLLLIEDSDILQYYTNFKKVFSKSLANNLPLHSEFNYKIELNGEYLRNKLYIVVHHFKINTLRIFR